MPILQCYVDDATLRILKDASNSSGRTVEELAESAIAETALKSTKSLSAYERGLHLAAIGNMPVG